MAVETRTEKIPAFTLKTTSYSPDEETSNKSEKTFVEQPTDLLRAISLYVDQGRTTESPELEGMIGSCSESGNPNWLDSAFLYEYVPHEHSFKITRLL